MSQGGSGSELRYCGGYVDKHGQWNTGFHCPPAPGPAGLPEVCCGPEHARRCCTEADFPQTRGARPGNSHTLPLLVGGAAASALVLLVTVLVVCFYCRGCWLYKWRRKRAGHGSTDDVSATSGGGGAAYPMVTVTDTAPPSGTDRYYDAPAYHGGLPPPPPPGCYPLDDPPPYPGDTGSTNPVPPVAVKEGGPRGVVVSHDNRNNNNPGDADGGAPGGGGENQLCVIDCFVDSGRVSVVTTTAGGLADCVKGESSCASDRRRSSPAAPGIAGASSSPSSSSSSSPASVARHCVLRTHQGRGDSSSAATTSRPSSSGTLTPGGPWVYRKSVLERLDQHQYQQQQQLRQQEQHHQHHQHQQQSPPSPPPPRPRGEVMQPELVRMDSSPQSRRRHQRRRHDTFAKSSSAESAASTSSKVSPVRTWKNSPLGFSKRVDLDLRPKDRWPRRPPPSSQTPLVSAGSLDHPAESVSGSEGYSSEVVDTSTSSPEPLHHSEEYLTTASEGSRGSVIHSEASVIHGSHTATACLEQGESWSLEGGKECNLCDQRTAFCQQQQPSHCTAADSQTYHTLPVQYPTKKHTTADSSRLSATSDGKEHSHCNQQSFYHTLHRVPLNSEQQEETFPSGSCLHYRSQSADDILEGDCGELSRLHSLPQLGAQRTGSMDRGRGPHRQSAAAGDKPDLLRSSSCRQQQHNGRQRTAPDWRAGGGSGYLPPYQPEVVAMAIDSSGGGGGRSGSSQKIHVGDKDAPPLTAITRSLQSFSLQFDPEVDTVQQQQRTYRPRHYRPRCSEMLHHHYHHHHSHKPGCNHSSTGGSSQRCHCSCQKTTQVTRREVVREDICRPPPAPPGSEAGDESDTAPEDGDGGQPQPGHQQRGGGHREGPAVAPYASMARSHSGGQGNGNGSFVEKEDVKGSRDSCIAGTGAAAADDVVSYSTRESFVQNRDFRSSQDTSLGSTRDGMSYSSRRESYEAATSRRDVLSSQESVGGVSGSVRRNFVKISTV